MFHDFGFFELRRIKLWNIETKRSVRKDINYKCLSTFVSIKYLNVTGVKYGGRGGSVGYCIT
jgi:hypothetical protein